MKILVINGPNLNLLGIREPEVYGTSTYNDLCEIINDYCNCQKIEVSIIQSNHEGAIIDYIHEAYYNHYDGIVINPGAYTHYSYAIHDAISSIPTPVVEVHISDISKRESFRQHSVISDVCCKSIMGHGLNGYVEAIQELQYIKNKATN